MVTVIINKSNHPAVRPGKLYSLEIVDDYFKPETGFLVEGIIVKGNNVWTNAKRLRLFLPEGTLTVNN